LISQDIKSTSDNVRFTFGNGDRVMTQLANDTDLKYAEIDPCLFHVNSGILLRLWKGVIRNFTSDGTPIFPVTCSDGFLRIMNQYPERQVSRQCWKTYNDGVNCPWGAQGASAATVTAAGGDPTTCDCLPRSQNSQCTKKLLYNNAGTGMSPRHRPGGSKQGTDDLGAPAAPYRFGSVIPSSVSTLGLGSSCASRLWQALQSPLIASPPAALCPPS
jgi:hypothetical protein